MKQDYQKVTLEVVKKAVTARRDKCLNILLSMDTSAQYSDPRDYMGPGLPCSGKKHSVLMQTDNDGNLSFFDFTSFMTLEEVLNKLYTIKPNDPGQLWSIKWNAFEQYQILKSLIAYDCSELCEYSITHLCEMLDPGHNKGLQ